VGQNVEILTIKAGGTHSYRYALSALYSFFRTAVSLLYEAILKTEMFLLCGSRLFMSSDIPVHIVLRDQNVCAVAGRVHIYTHTTDVQGLLPRVCVTEALTSSKSSTSHI
jgi:hypothetical protein